jgi:DNA-binding CsgD family transcriptional regulator
VGPIAVDVRLDRRDLWRLSDAIKCLHAQTTLDQLTSATVACVQTLVDCDWGSVSLASPTFARPTRFWSPYSRQQDRFAAPFAAFYNQHPNWRAFWKRLRPDAQQLLEVSTAREAASLPIFNEVFKPLRIGNLLGVPMPGSSMFVVSAIRDMPRLFSARDCLVLEVLGHHLAAAARAFRRTTPSAVDYTGLVEFVALDPLGRVVGESAGTSAMLQRFFPPPPASGDLPTVVRTWLARSPLEPVLCVVRKGHTLEIRRFDPRVRPGHCLVLYEHDLAESWSALPELTLREAEVVKWVAEGKTNPEIASILGISALTVKKHLEHVFDKLGTSTRTALVAEVLARAGR